MEEKNCEILFEYLRSILYDDKVRPLDLETLDEPFRKLGMGLQYLDKAVSEMKEYSKALAVGNLSVTPPGRENFLCENLKNIHSNLNHLTWQAKQVARGDYTQTVSFLGEFSDAFNSMTQQLSERETELKVEAYRDKLTKIGNRHFFSQYAELLLKSDEDLIFCYCDLDHLKYVNDTYGHAEGDRYLCTFVDMVTNSVRKKDIFARLGGDEFCIIFRGCPMEKAVEKMYNMQEMFQTNTEKSYPKDFSFGMVEVGKENRELSLNEIIHKADAAMYEQKRKHKTEKQDAISCNKM